MSLVFPGRTRIATGTKLRPVFCKYPGDPQYERRGHGHASGGSDLERVPVRPDNFERPFVIQT